MNRGLRAAAWLALLGAALVGLRWVSTGDLAPPPLSSPDALEAWVELRGPFATALALVRLVSEVAAWYLLALSTLHLLGRAVSSDPLRAVADVVSLGGSKRLVHAALGLGIVAAGTPLGEQPDSAPTETVVEERRDRLSGVRVGTGAATMRPLGDHDDGRAEGETAWMTPVPAEDTGVLSPPAPPATWRVEQGDSFWSIASEILEGAWQRSPADREIDPFWRALVDANRDRLVAHADPDLIVPGQVFEVPALPPPR